MRVRRTQEERSATMRARLLEATIDCLVDLGYARTTTNLIAERAGVSRGAQLHHYPTKAQLVIAAVAWLFDRRELEFRRAIGALPAGRARAAAAVELLWAMCTDRTFWAWLELTVAARTDGDLRREVRRLHARTLRNIERAFHDLFAQPDTKRSKRSLHALAPTFTLAVLQGLALDKIAARADRRRRGVLEAVKQLSPLFIMEGAA
jgi:AcrR family transcriptional regulator